MGQITTSDGGPPNKSSNTTEDDISSSSPVVGQKTISCSSIISSSSSLFNVPGLFVGLAPKCILDYDSSVKSPTSPLELKIFSNLGSSFRFPSSVANNNNNINNNKPKCWECDKVGLGILDSLDAGNDGCDACGGGGNGVVVTTTTTMMMMKPSHSSKTILFGPQVKTKTNPHVNNNIHEEKEESSPKPKDNNNPPIFSYTKPQIINSTSLDHLPKGKKSDVFFEIVEDSSPYYPPCRKTHSFSLDDSSKRMAGINNHHKNSGSRLGGSAELKNPEKKSNLDLVAAAAAAVAAANVVVVPNISSSSSNKSLGSLSASEIELSEDYTRVITRGPNPKTTHIFGDCVLESHNITTTTTTTLHDVGNTNSSRVDSGFGLSAKEEEAAFDDDDDDEQQHLLPFPPSSDEFLSFCYFCCKKLEEGKDIYMYRGEKAFCSFDCRLEEILIEEGKEKSSATEEAPTNESLST